MTKYNKNLTIKEVSNMLGLTRSNLYTFLRNERIMLKTNGTNIPSDLHIKRLHFVVSYSLVDNDSFSGVVPKVRVTRKGFFFIKKRLENKRNIYDREFEKAMIEVDRFKNFSDKSYKIVKKNDVEESLIFKNKVLIHGNFIKNKIWIKTN